MLRLDVLRSTPVSRSARARQLEGIFDVPPRDRIEHRWEGEVDLDLDGDWNVGLVVGPSGSGKSTVAREIFGDVVDHRSSWESDSVIDDFDPRFSIQDVAAACQAVGFNTIPSWLKPHSVLSTGERFRVDLARRLLEQPDPVVVDEFTSVVDRQVARIGSWAAAKYARRNDRRFVAVTCHYDVVDWLDPDWVLEPSRMKFERRRLRRVGRGNRPEICVRISAVDRSAWPTFAPYHYLTERLHRSAKCFCAFVDDEPTSISCMLHRPNSRGSDVIYGQSRVVTLPDWQGVGLAFALSDTLAAAYKTVGCNVHTYPAHPAFVRALDRSRVWQMRKRPGCFSRSSSRTSSRPGEFGGRPCAVFRYVGDSLSDDDARDLLEPHYPRFFR